MLFGINPIKGLAAYGAATESIRQQIHLGLILPGEHLPPERKLCEAISVSRVTLREAIRVLDTEGYLTIKRGAHGGTIVVDQSRLDKIALTRIHRDPSTVFRAMEFWTANSVASAQLAVQRSTPSDIKQLRLAVRAIGAAKEAAALRRAESDFHLAVASASGNGFMQSAIAEAMGVVFLPAYSSDVTVVGAQRQAACQAVAEAIEKKKKAEVAPLMQELMTTVALRLRELPKAA